MAQTTITTSSTKHRHHHWSHNDQNLYEEGYRQAKEQIAQLEAELAEFQQSSRELENELELELEESEQRHKRVQKKVFELNNQVNEWKVGAIFFATF
jgi:chromosome segregation ATPase